LRYLNSEKTHWAIFVDPGKVKTLLPKLKGADFVEYAANCNTKKYEASVFVQTIEEAPEGSSPVETDIGYRLTYKEQKDIKKDFKNIRKNEKIKIGVPINTYYRAINAAQAQIGCRREQIIVDDYFFIKPVTFSLTSTEITEDKSVVSRIPISNKVKSDMIRKLKSGHISGDLLELAIVYAEDLDDIETLVYEPDFISKILNDITETDKCMELLEYISVTQGKGWEAACDEIYSNFCS
jgi:hypothetical protein